MRKLTTLALAGAMTAAMACTAFAVDGTISYDFANGAFTADDEWGQCWIQVWGGNVTINSADVTLADGTVVSNVAMDAKNVITLIGEEAVVEDGTAVAKVTYNVTYDDAEIADEEAWIGGGIGLNSDSTGWLSIEFGKASGEKAIAIEDTLAGGAPAGDADADASGDVAPVAYLAAIVAVAGLAMVASKKRA